MKKGTDLSQDSTLNNSCTQEKRSAELTFQLHRVSNKLGLKTGDGNLRLLPADFLQRTQEPFLYDQCCVAGTG